MEGDPSPSNCTYCYSLESSVRIETLSSNQKRGAVSAKNSIVTVGRNANRQIVLQVELLCSRSGGQPAVVSYPLADCVVHQQGVEKGRGSIEIPSRRLAIQLTNCAPRKLNVFLKSLQAKLELMRQEFGGPDNSMKTPVNMASRSILQQGLPNVFNVLSPLSVGEIRKVRRLRGVATGASPLTKGAKSPAVKEAGSRLTLKNVQATTPKAPSKRASGGAPLATAANRNGGGVEVVRTPLSDEQRRVVRVVVQGRKNVFFTGSAGTGKSLILRRIIEMLPALTTYVTAATGVAACQLGGVTLHSFAGIGLGTGSKENCLKNAESKKNVVKQWKNCTHLIIDEISMVDADYFTNIEFVARNVRGDPRPFGGIQLIITGDFLQLPPVVKGVEDIKFCFESSVWNQAIQETILLKTVRRQDDEKFVGILQQIRVGRCDTTAAFSLAETKKNDFTRQGVVPTRLCTHTADAEAVNKNNLEKLEGITKVFTAEDGQFIPDTLKSMVVKNLVLKVNAQVMLNKNLDLSRGLSNGSRGVVTKFSKNGLPVVSFLSTKEEIEIAPVRFAVRVPGCEDAVCRKQLPLQLAWAISIHKSQGLTLDAVEMSLSKVFADGQAYVALSRARSLSAIRVLGFDPSVIRSNQKVVDYYESIAEDSKRDEEELGGFVIRKRSRLS